MVQKFYEIGESPINYNDLIMNCKDINNLNETSADTIKQLHEVVLEDVYENLKPPPEFYLDQFIDHVVIKLIENLNPKVRRSINQDIFEYENEIDLKKLVYFTKYLKNENEILKKQDEKFLEKIASRREKQNTDDESNCIPTETILFLKSLILCCLNEELDSIFCLSKLYLSNKIKFDSCYKMAKQIFDLGKEYSDSDNCKISFYLLFSDYDSCVELCENSEDVKLKQMKEEFKNLSEIVNKFELNNNEGSTCTSNSTLSGTDTHNSNADEKENDENSDDSSANQSENAGDEIPNNNNNRIEIKNDASSKKYFILSIDGGGIRGLIPLYFLRELEMRLKKKVYDLFDMFAGTSIGGLIALILSQKKYSAEELLKKMLGSFKNEIFLKKKYFFNSIPNEVIHGHKYDETDFEKLLRDELKDLTLFNSQGNYFVTSNIVNTQNDHLEPCVFVRNEGMISDTKTGIECELLVINEDDYYEVKFNCKGDFDETELYKIGRATSAACPYFNYIEIEDKKKRKKKFVEGGFTHNNPSFLVYEYVKNRNKIKSENIHVLSLGCFNDKYEHSHKGFINKINLKNILYPWILSCHGYNWTESSVDNVISTDNKYVNTLMFREIKNNYNRISPGTFEKPIKLDGIPKVEIWTLQEAARKMIKKSIGKIETFCTSHDLSTDVSERYNKIDKFRTRYDQCLCFYSELNSIVQKIALLEKEKSKQIKLLEEENKEKKANLIRLFEEEKSRQIKLLEEEIKDFKFEFKFQIDEKDFNDQIYIPFKPGDQICYSCKSLAIGYLPAFEILKPENYFNENYKSEYESKSEKIIHICCSDWTQYHFVAANNEIASFIYLLKERLFQIEITETLDSIISYKVERKNIEQRIECEKHFLSHILNERRTSEDFSKNNQINKSRYKRVSFALYNIFKKIFTKEDEKKLQSAIELSEITHGDNNNLFIIFIKTVIEDLEKLFKRS